LILESCKGEQSTLFGIQTEIAKSVFSAPEIRRSAKW